MNWLLYRRVMMSSPRVWLAIAAKVYPDKKSESEPVRQLAEVLELVTLHGMSTRSAPAQMQEELRLQLRVYRIALDVAQRIVLEDVYATYLRALMGQSEDLDIFLRTTFLALLAGTGERIFTGTELESAQLLHELFQFVTDLHVTAVYSDRETVFEHVRKKVEELWPIPISPEKLSGFCQIAAEAALLYELAHADVG